MTKSALRFMAAFSVVAVAINCNSTAQPKGNPQYCWGEVAGEPISNPDLLARVAIATTGDQVWAAWQEKNAIGMGTWIRSKPVPLPARPGGNARSFDPILRATEKGDVFLARRSQTCRTDVLISLWRGGEWLELGSPQGGDACKKDATNADMAIDDRGFPVVVWESRTGTSVRNLKVARWNGSTWSRIGAPITVRSGSYSLEPSITIRAKQMLIAWVDGNEARSHVRASSWNGKEWVDVGKSRSGNLRMKYSARHPKVGVRPNGDVMVAWIDRGQPAAAVAVAQWNGRKWQMSSPVQSELQLGALALSMGKNAPPLLSWDSEDSGFNRSINVWQLGTQGWSEVISGLHLASAPSYITQSAMAADEETGEVHLIWQEDQDQSSSRHIVRVYSCEKGEVPKSIPQRPTRQSLWPQTVEAAATMLLDTMDSEGKEAIRQTKKTELAKFHFGWGTSIRNNLGLWMGNTALLISCGNGKVVDADSCSGTIVERVWLRLQN